MIPALAARRSRLPSAAAAASALSVRYRRSRAGQCGKPAPFRHTSRSEIPCDDTFLSAQCLAHAVVTFVVRMRDGRRTYAQTVGPPAQQLMCGGFIYGPALTPFGFFRRIGADNAPASLATPAPPPENLAEDPFGSRSIASVTVKDSAYAVALVGLEDLDGTSVYHLHLVPNYDPAHHPLRELWVDTRTFEVCSRSPTRAKRRAARPRAACALSLRAGR